MQTIAWRCPVPQEEWITSPSDHVAAAVTKVFVTDARPWEQLLDDAAAIIGEASELCLIGVGTSSSSVFAPLGVYAEPERLTRINETPGFAWPVSEQASAVMSSGNPSFSDGPVSVSGHAGSAAWGPWDRALEGLAPLEQMMIAIRFAGVSVGLVAVARESPRKAYTQADVQALEPVVDVLALALQDFQDRPDDVAVAHVEPRMTRATIALLTSRERRIVLLLAEGLTNAEIATGMHLSERTIEWYRARILAKLDHPTRAELVILGRNLGA